MSPIVHDIEIDCPPERIFAYATEPTRFHEWQWDVESARITHATDEIVGSTYSSTRRLAGIDVTQHQEIVEHEPPTRWAARGIDGPVRADATITIEALDDGARSRVTFTLDFHGPGVGRLMLPQVRRMAERAAPRSHLALKNLLENG